MKDSASFVAENLNRYFALGNPSGNNSTKALASIWGVELNEDSNNFVTSTQKSQPLVENISLPYGRTAPAGTSTTPRHPNGLGVTEDGEFFFTYQYRQALSYGGATHEFVDVWRYDSTKALGNDQAGNANPQRLVAGFDLGRSNSTPQQIVAGAYNPFDGAYYFGFYGGSGTVDNRIVELNLYKASKQNGEKEQWIAGTIGSAKLPVGNVTNATNGDFDFDAAGNLTFLLSGQGLKATAFIGTINSHDIQSADIGRPLTFEDFTTSKALTFSTGASGGQANGMVFARSGQMIVQSLKDQRMLNPNSLEETQAWTGFLQGNNLVAVTDLASFASPPTVRIDKNVKSRVDDQDQFTLSLGKGTSNQSITTNGIGTDTAAIGLQDRKLGPVGVYAGDEIGISESIALDSPSMDLSQYSQEFECVNESLDPSDAGYKITLTEKSGPLTRTFKVPSTPSGHWQGPQVVCTISNKAEVPRLKVEKFSDPESTKPVVEGQEVKYTLSFDNLQGTGTADDIEYTDYLGDVLDDAKFNAESLSVRDTTNPEKPILVNADFFAWFDETTQRLKISGAADGSGPAAVPAGKRYEVSYTVTVNPNLDDVGKPRENEGLNTAYAMRNFLVEGDAEIPDKCEPAGEGEPALCSEHSVKAWTVAKDSKPSDGARLHHGGNVYYSLEVQKTDPGYDLGGIVVTDDLTDVMRVAAWDPSAPSLAGTRNRGIHFLDENGAVVRMLDASSVPEPVFNGTDRWTLTTEPFDLKEGEARAEVWFAVKVGNPPQIAPNWLPEAPTPGTKFTNTVTAAAGEAEPEANQCRTGVPAGAIGGAADSCSVTHFIGSDYFTVRKDGRGTLDNGDTKNLQNLIGHEFELRTDVNGSMGGAPDFMCDAPSEPPAESGTETCARFYPIPNGAQAGRWRAEKVPAGTYWLLETKAPDAQRVSATETRKVTGVQLLAQPVKFVVGSEDDFGQLDIFKSGMTEFEGRCNPTNSPENIACVSPTGYLMVVKDPSLLPLPMSGGQGANLLTVGAAVLIAGGLAVGILWRRKRYGQQASA